MESSKPTKNQLNPKIISDIVQYVTKRCKVTDTAVRSSITTKCADENKMMRQRNDKNRKSLVKVENKENQSTEAKPVLTPSNNNFAKWISF